MLTKLLPSFIQTPDLKSVVTEPSVELIFICCAFFSLMGVIRLPTKKVNALKNNETKMSDEAIFLIDIPLVLITTNSEFPES